MRKRFYIFSRFSETNRDLDSTPESHTFTLCLVAETNLLFLFTFCNPIKNPTLQSTTKKHHYEPSIWIGMGPFPNSIFFYFICLEPRKNSYFQTTTTNTTFTLYLNRVFPQSNLFHFSSILRAKQRWVFPNSNQFSIPLVFRAKK